MIKKIIIIPILFLLFLSSCKSVKEGLSGKKAKNSDEFLVEKKNPLVLPPDFEKLPSPEIDTTEKDTDEKQKIKDMILSSSDKIEKKESDNTSIEKIIIDQIKND